MDGSATATRGLREAIRLAQSERSKLILLHVVANPYIDDAMFADASFSPGLYALLRKEGRKVLFEKPGMATADLILREGAK